MMMVTKFIEATDESHFNHGKFMVGKFEAADWGYRSAVFAQQAVAPELSTGINPSLLGSVCGWDSRRTILVMDLQTGEGGLFTPGGHAPADLEKHKLWVCPMFEPFLVWLYTQPLKTEADIARLPPLVNLGAVPTALFGYRRPGPRGYWRWSELEALEETR